MATPRKTAAKKTAPSRPTEPEVVALGGDISNAGESTIVQEIPYTVEMELTGDVSILFHRWQSDAIEAKAKAGKGSTQKKTDDLESYVWRNEDHQICLPGEYVRGTLVDPQNGAAKYRQDPRSPRKSALDLFKAGVVSMTELAPITKADGKIAMEWDYVDRRRARIQRSGITRERPAFNAGWTAVIRLMVLTPQLIPPVVLRQAMFDAGRLVGVGNFRPTFGRFSVTRFEVLADH